MLGEKLHEECGVFGVHINTQEAAGITYNALSALQHRGQEGAGIAVLSKNAILCHKDVGLVSEVFNGDTLKKLPASGIGIGHVRYSTTGGNICANVQPVVTEFLRGRIAIAHNGNIVNAGELKELLSQYGCAFSATSDSEVISALIAYEIIRNGNLQVAVTAAARQLRGAFSLIVLSSDGTMIAVRDGWGFRPLCLGENDHGHAIASESCALDSAGFRFIRDIEPGEMVIIDPNGNLTACEILEKDNKGLCIFEYVYFARPDSVIDGLSVYEARYNMGIQLAREYPVEADLVVGVPDSGLVAAKGYSEQSGIPYGMAFHKNSYVGRTFIKPKQSDRESSVKIKLNVIPEVVKGKRIVMVDDSIVRGTTCANIIKMLKKAGATEVHVRISSPPFLHPCYFGTDVPSNEQLIAHSHTPEQIRDMIGADSLGYMEIEKLKNMVGDLHFCDACFTGNYPMEVPGEDISQAFE